LFLTKLNCLAESTIATTLSILPSKKVQMMIVLDMLMDGIRFQSFQFKMKKELGKRKTNTRLNATYLQ